MSTEIALPVPARVGQATAIEQSRAVAEVHAAILVAQQCPRNVQAAIAAMRQSCAMSALAERAFYKVPRGNKLATDVSIHLARDLARCWGNIQHGVAELRRDDDHGQSEMQAWAWEVQTNTRTSVVFIVPHKRDRKETGPEKLVDLQAIYENNANAGARRLRQCILGVLPPWFVEEAKERCRKTMVDGPVDETGKPLKTLPQRIADVLAAFTEIGVTEDDVTRKLGRPSSKWTAFDVADLVVVGKSIRNGEVNRDDEFPPDVVTAAEITASAPAAAAADPVEQPADSPADSPAEITENITRPDPPPKRVRPKAMNAGVFHDRGHTPAGSDLPRTAWDPECTVCADDAKGQFHYYDHAQHQKDCTYCQREQAWASTQDGGQP